jgi:hemerythrin
MLKEDMTRRSEGLLNDYLSDCHRQKHGGLLQFVIAAAKRSKDSTIVEMVERYRRQVLEHCKNLDRMVTQVA